MCVYPCRVLAFSDKVVFAPCEANVVGIFHVTTNSFETVPTGSLTGDWKFNGAARVGSKVVFAPWDANPVGVLDTRTSSFETVSTGSLSMGNKLAGAVAISFQVTQCKWACPFGACANTTV